MQLSKKPPNLIREKGGKLVDLLIQKTCSPYKKDEIIAKILSMKKLLNLVRTEEEKLKGIANAKKPST